ncbi:MAG: hypothetical protein ACRD4B_08665 [Acidobacteriota bacterium]
MTPEINEANANGIITHHVINSVATYALRTTSGSRPIKPTIASAKKDATDPNQPTDEITCIVKENLRTRGGIIAACDPRSRDRLGEVSQTQEEELPEGFQTVSPKMA